ncbi:class I SAM-dependent methyltransferase [Actinacidiphila paucisporea]|uniref:Methyltransferase domain-containing protein n=1 Tax=Actinacidiphila paucisporea TaxID=310782 RepID=A0A1M6W8W6_9ACTN|nr:class I SAM-dependent methyltransferase [Actinacidiphila paucisporea]SHK90204.1 Methyltransferase domain-containing protein [Actinacidiphila paucisporea]
MTLTPTASEPAGDELPAPASLAEVKGWFFPVDQVLFDWFLTRQSELTEPGDLLEIGAYMGKSAIFMGSYLRSGETFTVCDLFDSPARDDANSAEMRYSYSTLTRRSFESNYLSFHDELPTVIQGLSSLVRDRVQAASCRFAHIDGSHLYEHVRGDIEDTRTLLHPHGIVALDDYRSEHCPGVAAAVWEAVATGGLNPVCVTGTKLYGTWGDPGPVREQLLEFLAGRDDLWHAVEAVAGGKLVRVKGAGAVLPAQPPSRHHREEPPVEEAPPVKAPATPEAPAVRRRSPLRRLVLNVLPPFVSKGFVRLRAALRHQA